MFARYYKDLFFDRKTFHGSRSEIAPKSPSFSRVYDTLFLRRIRKLEDGCVVEEGNVVVRASGDKGVSVDSPGISRMKLVGVHPERSSRLARREDGGGPEKRGSYS